MKDGYREDEDRKKRGEKGKEDACAGGPGAAEAVGHDGRPAGEKHASGDPSAAGASAAAPGSEAKPGGEDSRAARRRELDRMTKKELEEAYLDLEEKARSAEARAREYLEDARRQKAELENYRKRMIREQTRIVEQANRNLIAGLLPVIDNLEKALESCSGRDDALAQGVRMVYEQLMSILKKEGLEEINPHGHPFDPAECEAVMAVISDDHEEDTVVEVHQKGYRYKGDLLRPARATVSKCNN